MEAFLYSLLVVAVPALGIMAYRHHRAMVKIFNLLYWISLALLLGASFWNFTVQLTGSKIHQQLREYSYTEIEEAVDPLLVPYSTGFVVWLVWIVYLSILRFLPQILQLPDRDDENADKDGPG